jgi:GAF domain-containing protein
VSGLGLPFLAIAKHAAAPVLAGFCGGQVLSMSERSNGLNQAALSELAGLLMATESFEDLMQRIAELSARTVAGASTCGITLAQDGHVITVASADPLARLLDEQQYELDQGPCLEALSTGVVVSAPDLSRETRWNGYPARALAHDVRAVHSSPLLVNDRPIGALNLYATTTDPFDAAAQETAAQLTALAAATITAAMRHYNEATLTDHLRSALFSRSVIDQAIGIVMATQHCTSDEAFNILRTVSQHRNIPIRQVAADLVAKTSDNSTPT